MSLAQKTFLLSSTIVGLALLEFLLSALGIGWPYRLPLLVVILVVTLLLLRQVLGLLTKLRVLRKAIDDTSRGELQSVIPIEEQSELGNVADALRSMRLRLSEMGNQMYKSVRIESLNILGSILVHDMKNLSFRLRTLNGNIAARYADPAFRESLVNTLNDTTAQMDRMVKRFRERKEMVIVKLRTDLNEVVHSALLKGRRDNTRIQISEEYGNLPLVWVDAMLIESAMLTIFDNAREAMPEGGLMAVRTGVMAAEGDIPPLAVIEIGDTGIGMSAEFISRDLFAPFVTTKPRGLGLGLYTCRQIIHMHDGVIRVRSEAGRGTVFSIYLPITD